MTKKQDPSTTKLELPDIPDEVEVKDYMTYWLPSGVYDILKWLALIGLPAIGVFYSALAGIWNLPGANEVASTLQVVGLAIGTVIGVSEISAATARK
ncbi:phage holin [Collinsella tanakaei]|uniref:phage holin n=1 Tax=Collinsella tanakaei TaxID=626935 RepID=UPI0022DEBA98|nr:phage holin [Collinsella tanakaei]